MPSADLRTHIDFLPLKLTLGVHALATSKAALPIAQTKALGKRKEWSPWKDRHILGPVGFHKKLMCFSSLLRSLSVLIVKHLVDCSQNDLGQLPVFERMTMN